MNPGTILFHTNDAALDDVAKDPELDAQTKELFLLLVNRNEFSHAVKAIEQFCALMRRGYVRVHGFPPAPLVLYGMAQKIGPRKKIRVQEFISIMQDVMGNFPAPSV